MDIRSLLTELQDELRTAHPERKLELELATDHKVMGDYRELYSAVSNLVLNAIRYSVDNTVVNVSWSRRDGGYHLAVSDRVSVSMPPTFRASRSDSTGWRTVAHRPVVVRAWGWRSSSTWPPATGRDRLKIDSKPGKGSTFSLVFPGQGRG